MIRRMLILAATLTVFAAAPLAHAAGALDGKTFSGVIGKKGETATQPDSLVFKDGTFESTLCTTFGYGTGAYQTTPQDEGMTFTAQTTSGTGGTMDWHGVVIGDQIEATVTTMENGQKSESWFQGKVKGE